ncbi:MAG: repeat containing protein, partial [Verrucomicrobia bacterium]|nr:repeat containing protein [Verrucomicrobiota bacterium]
NAGNVYVADAGNQLIRRITSGGLVTPVAGLAGFAGSTDGVGSLARFNTPGRVAVDAVGTLYVADYLNNTIRKITSDGAVTTLAGSAGLSGFANGTGSGARFNRPFGIAVDNSGSVYVSDTGNHTIRMITSSGVVTTVAGNGAAGSSNGTGTAASFSSPTALAVDSGGNIYVADGSNYLLRKIASGGVVTTLAGSPGISGSVDGTGSAARFSGLNGVGVDGAGNVFVSDGNTIRKITSAGVVTTFAGVADAVGASVDGTGSAARFALPYGLSLDAAGNIYVAERFAHTIRKVTSGGVVTTFAGVAGGKGSADGVGSVARFSGPDGIVSTNAGIFVADPGNHSIRKITAGGIVTTFVGSATFGYADGTGNTAQFMGPTGIAADNGGNLYVADNGAVRKVTPGGVVTTLAGVGGLFGSVDGTGTAARFNGTYGIAVDTAGNVYVSDNTIRKITSAGVVTTLAGGMSAGFADGTGTSAKFYAPRGLAVDNGGNIYVADSNNHAIRKVTSAGVVTTIAGSFDGTPGSTDGTGNAARFNRPYGITVDVSGNIFVAELENHTIRKISNTGVVTTIGGIPNVIGSADGTGSDARFAQPAALTVDAAGALYVADLSNHIVRIGTYSGPQPPIIVGQPVSQNVAVGGSVTFAVTASGNGPFSYQWFKNGVVINQATSLTYTIGSALAADAGAYTALVTNSAGSTLRAAAFLTTTTAVPGRLVNLSVRIGAGTGDATLIVGVVIGGTGTAGSKRLLVRGIGPTLSSYGVSGVLIDPITDFIRQGSATPIATNDNWSGDAQVKSVANTVGAFALPDDASKDSALYLTPDSGVYSLNIRGNSGATGIALAELYDADGIGYTATTPRLVNLSARAQVGTGEGVLIAGFVIEGGTSRTVLVRAIGPTLASYGVSGALTDPQLEITQMVNGSLATVASNDNWSGNAQISIVSATVGAFDLSNAGSKDAALLVTLPPGVYSAKVSGVGNTIGVALIEVYEVP